MEKNKIEKESERANQALRNTHLSHLMATSSNETASGAIDCLNRIFSGRITTSFLYCCNKASLGRLVSNTVPGPLNLFAACMGW
jgi:hypothetical protein